MNPPVIEIYKYEEQEYIPSRDEYEDWIIVCNDDEYYGIVENLACYLTFPGSPQEFILEGRTAWIVSM